MRIDSTGQVLIGETANPNMTTGVTINQGANDDQVLTFKSVDIGHGMTSAGYAIVETDDYFTIKKQSPTLGGANISVFAEDDALTQVTMLNSHGGTADTTKTTAGLGLVGIRVLEHNGSNGAANITADGNVFVVRAQVGGGMLTRFLIDEDGDMYTATAGQTFDDYDDVALIEAYDHVRSGDAAYEIKSEFGKFATVNEAALIEAGVLGGSVAEGGLTNQTQLIRVLTGAARQQAERIRQLEVHVAGLLPAGA